MEKNQPPPSPPLSSAKAQETKISSKEDGCGEDSDFLDLETSSLKSLTLDTPHGNTPLMSACQIGDCTALRKLLPSGEINAQNSRSETSLILACRKHLLHQSIDKNIDNTFDLGCLLAHDILLSMDVLADQSDSYTDVVELLLSHGADVDVVDDDGFTPLILASIFGEAEVTEMLLSRGVDVNATGIFGSTALTWACVFGHVNIVDRLIEAGADVNVMADSDSALCVSTSFGRQRIVDKLLSIGISCDDIDDALYIATALGFGSIASLLLSHTETQTDKADSEKDSPLMVASMSGQSSLVELLIAHGADVNQQGTDGTTPLLCSAMLGQPDAARLLLANGADIEACQLEGMTALMWACLGGWEDIMELLLDRGADINATDTNGDTPLIFLCKYFEDIFHLLLDDLQKDENEHDDVGNVMVVLFLLCKYKLNFHDKIMTQLKSMCSDITQKCLMGFASVTGDTDLLTSLQLAFSDQHTDTPAATPDDDEQRQDRMLKMLLSHGAEVNASNNDGDTALIEACAAGYESRARILLEHGADVNISNTDGETALSFAKIEGHPDIEKMLLSHS